VRTAPHRHARMVAATEDVVEPARRRRRPARRR
jgi:hypothetical protein